PLSAQHAILPWALGLRFCSRANHTRALSYSSALILERSHTRALSYSSALILERYHTRPILRLCEGAMSAYVKRLASPILYCCCHATRSLGPAEHSLSAGSLAVPLAVSCR